MLSWPRLTLKLWVAFDPKVPPAVRSLLSQTFPKADFPLSVPNQTFIW